MPWSKQGTLTTPTTGEARALGYGIFYQATGQSIPSGSTSFLNARLSWDSQQVTPKNCALSDNNRTITINKAGLWMVSLFVRYAGSFNANRLMAWLGSPIDSTVRYGFGMVQPTTVLQDPGVSFAIQLPLIEGGQFSAWTFQESGVARSTFTLYQSTGLTLSFLGAFD